MNIIFAKTKPVVLLLYFEDDVKILFLPFSFNAVLSGTKWLMRLIQHAICALHTTGLNVLFEAVTKVRAKQLKTSSSVSVCALHLFSPLPRGTNQKIFSDALTTISKLNYIIQSLYTYNINFPSIPAHCCVDAVFPLAARAAVTAWAKQCK